MGLFRNRLLGTALLASVHFGAQGTPAVVEQPAGSSRIVQRPASRLEVERLRGLAAASSDATAHLSYAAATPQQLRAISIAHASATGRVTWIGPPLALAAEQPRTRRRPQRAVAPAAAPRAIPIAQAPEAASRLIVGAGRGDSAASARLAFAPSASIPAGGRSVGGSTATGRLSDTPVRGAVGSVQGLTDDELLLLAAAMSVRRRR